MCASEQVTYNKKNERRTRSKTVCQQLTDERAEMLINFCRVAGVDPFDEPHQEEELEELLQNFCRIMVDYLATGHFGLYQRILDGSERRGEISTVAEQLYPGISDTTTTAMAFNDKYETNTEHQLDGAFAEDLSTLGQALATRIELEDQLLKMLS